MGPGAGLIVGIPFVVLTLALLAIFRRERLHPERGGPSRPWRLFVRVVAVILLAFVAFMVVELVFKLPFGPAPGS
jgi:hypothetical protein